MEIHSQTIWEVSARLISSEICSDSREKKQKMNIQWDPDCMRKEPGTFTILSFRLEFLICRSSTSAY